MKKKQKNILLLAIKNYISYISIALLCCALIGLTIFWFSVSELNNAAKEAECAKLQISANTLENQFVMLEDVRNDICTTVRYSPEQLFYGPKDSFAYREIELLEHFSAYQAYSPLCSNYFLYYINTNYVYTNTSKVAFDSYFSSPRNELFSTDSHIAELKQFFNTTRPSTHGILINASNDAFLLIFPLRLTYSTAQPNAVLGFIFTKSDLLNLITPIPNYFAGNISIRYFDSPMFGDEQQFKSSVSWNDGIAYQGSDIISRSANGYFTIYDSISPNTWNTALHSYRTFSIVFLVIAVLVAALLIITSAYRQYLPIHRTSQKIRTMMPAGETFKGIEDAISKVYQQSNSDKHQIQTQLDQLKSQSDRLKDHALMLALSGNATWLNQTQLNEVGIDLSGSFFRVFVLEFVDDIPDFIFSEIEKLSDEDQHYYAVKISDDEVAVISSFFLESTAQDGAAFLQELSVSQGEPLFTVSSNLTVDKLEQLVVSYYSAKNITVEVPSLPQIDETPEDYTHYLLLLLKSIREGNSSDAHSYLALLTDYISRKCESFLIQKYVLADIVSQINRFSHSINVPLDTLESGATLVLRDPDSIFKNLKTIIDRLLSQIQQQNEKAEGDIALRIKAYIDTNAFDYNCSLQQISSYFKLSPKQINSYLKEVTGLGYKDYEVSIRIKRAHTLLADINISVAAISEQIGYTDVSSFIKAFKKITGLSPAEYRKKYYGTGSR